MKILTCLVFVCLFISQHTSAQSVQNRATFGVKAGGGLSTFGYRNEREVNYYSAVFKWTSSFYGGFTANISFSKFFFQPELLYSLRGFRYQGYSKGTRYGYISMPLLFGYKPVKQLGIVIGPEFGYIISSRSHFTIDGNSNTIKFINYRNTIDFDAGLAWYITSKISAEARFVYGVKPLYRGGYNSIGDEVPKDGYNKTLQLGISYRLK
jgi:hypothetical protein